jgi:hypothetical protein
VADDDPFPFGVGEDRAGAEREKAVEGTARDVEAELLDRQESPADRLAERVDQLENADPPKEVAVPFWTAVIFADVGILLLVLGPLLAYFRGMVLPGAAITLAGAYALYRTYDTYREFRQSDPDTWGDDEETTESGPDDDESP